MPKNNQVQEHVAGKKIGKKTTTATKTHTQTRTDNHTEHRHINIKIKRSPGRSFRFGEREVAEVRHPLLARLDAILLLEFEGAKVLLVTSIAVERAKFSRVRGAENRRCASLDLQPFAGHSYPQKKSGNLPNLRYQPVA